MDRGGTPSGTSEGLPLLWLLAIFLAAGEGAWWLVWHVLGAY